MSVSQEDAKGASDPEEHGSVMPSRWRWVAAVSAASWVFLSLPLLIISILMLSSYLVDRGDYIESIWSTDFVLMVVLLNVSPLPIISAIATIAFLHARSARSRHIATICVRLSLVGMAALVVIGIAMMIEGKRMGGDTGPLKVIAAVLIGFCLPALVFVPSALGLISLWRLKRTIVEED